MIGAAANPFADPFELRARRLSKKAEAGADFVQTQCIYKWQIRRRTGAIWKRGRHKICVTAGITPFESAGMARYMQKRSRAWMYPTNWSNGLRRFPRTNRRRRGSPSPSKPSSVSKRSRASAASTSWPSSGSNEFRKSSGGPGFTRDRPFEVKQKGMRLQPIQRRHR